METKEELEYDEFVNVADIYLRINIEDKSNFYYLESDKSEKIYIILENVKNLNNNETNKNKIKKFIKNTNLWVSSIFLTIENSLKECKILKIPNNPSSCYQPFFLKDLNKNIESIQKNDSPKFKYVGSKEYFISAYKPLEKKIGQKDSYLEMNDTDKTP
jgi:hypothetical protein